MQRGEEYTGDYLGTCATGRPHTIRVPHSFRATCRASVGGGGKLECQRAEPETLSHFLASVPHFPSL